MPEYYTDYDVYAMECRRFVQAIENRDTRFIQNHMNKIRRNPSSHLFDVEGDNGLYPIHAAIETENIELVKFLSDLYVQGLGGYNQDTSLPLAHKGDRTQFALQMAFDTNNQEIIQLIWDRHATQEEYEHTLTHLIRGERVSAARQLIEMGKKNGWRPTQEHLNEIQDNYYPTVDEFYAEELGLTIEEVREKQRTEFYREIEAHMNEQNEQNAQNAQNEQTTEENQNTPIQTSQIQQKLPEQKLPEQNQDTTQPTITEQRRAELTDDLIIAITQEPFNPTRAEQLIKQGADVNFKDAIGYTPLHHAASLGASMEALEFLINAGANVNAVNKQGETPLITATTHNKRDVIRYLANHPETNLDCKDNKGNTALHYCVKTAYHEHVSIIASAGARSDIENNDGQTALEMARAIRRSHPNILNLLNREPIGKRPVKPSEQQTSGATAFLQEHAMQITEENEAIIRHMPENTMA